MNGETFKTITLLFIAALVCFAIHWLIGVAQRRLVRRFAPEGQESPEAPPSLRRLLFVWTGNGMRTAVWVLYFLFIVRVLPQTRTQFEDVNSRLMRLREDLLAWMLDRGVSLAVVMVATIFLMRFSSALIKAGFQLFERGTVKGDDVAARRRLQTLSAIFRGLAQVVIFFIGLMVLLQQMRVDITPILASAGLVGLALGLGAQNLIKDFFAGFLILLEEQFNVGDTVRIAETTGTVEQLTLRVTRIRALDGSLTTIPNGSIGAVANYTKEWSRAVLDIDVHYAADTDCAMQVMLEEAKKLWEERPLDILEEPSMLGVDRISNTVVTIKMIVKTAAGKHSEVGRELRRRIKLAFEQQGIKAPMQQQELVLKDDVIVESKSGSAG